MERLRIGIDGELQMKKQIGVAGAVAFVAMTTAGAAWAHHSFAMFDNQKTVVLQGTVKEFVWTNPHSWVNLMIRDASGKDIEWQIEGSSPNGLARRGWSRTSLNPGDKAEVTIHPLKNGAPGGMVVSVKVNGQLIGAPGAG